MVRERFERGKRIWYMCSFMEKEQMVEMESVLETEIRMKNLNSYLE
ncbi:hypothetical protein A2U01_0116998, partial [Trifolium medium]|nr:hypothetical protein [Trifolium medium]